MLDDALGVVSRTAGLRGDGDNPAVVRHIEVPVGQRRNIGWERRVGQVGLALARAPDRDLPPQRDAFDYSISLPSAAVKTESDSVEHRK